MCYAVLNVYVITLIICCDLLSVVVRVLLNIIYLTFVCLCNNLVGGKISVLFQNKAKKLIFV